MWGFESSVPSQPFVARVAHSSSGLGHRPLKAKITGSNPVCATIYNRSDLGSGRFSVFAADPAMSLPDHMDVRAPVQARTGSGMPGTPLEADFGDNEPARR